MYEVNGRYCDRKLQVPTETELGGWLLWMGCWDIRRMQVGKLGEASPHKDVRAPERSASW